MGCGAISSESKGQFRSLIDRKGHTGRCGKIENPFLPEVIYQYQDPFPNAVAESGQWGLNTDSLTAESAKSAKNFNR
jgi:hypothetical protein